FTQVIKPRPNELTGYVGTSVQGLEFTVWRHRPFSRVQVIRADVKVGTPLELVVGDREEVLPTGAETRCGFSAEQRHRRVRRMQRRVRVWLVVEPYDVDNRLIAIFAGAGAVER